MVSRGMQNRAWKGLEGGGRCAVRPSMEAKWLPWTLGEALGPESYGQILETLGTHELVHRTTE